MNVRGFRYQIDIQQPNSGNTLKGEPAQTWETIATNRASILPASGREYINGQKMLSEHTHQIYLRSNQDIDPTMRVRDTQSGHIYAILSAHQLEGRDRFTVLIVKRTWNPNY